MYKVVTTDVLRPVIPEEAIVKQVGASLVYGDATTEDELIKHCKNKLAGYKCPKTIEFWDELPKTPVGKILRRNVKKRFWEEGKNIA